MAVCAFGVIEKSMMLETKLWVKSSIRTDMYRATGQDVFKSFEDCNHLPCIGRILWSVGDVWSYFVGDFSSLSCEHFVWVEDILDVSVAIVSLEHSIWIITFSTFVFFRVLAFIPDGEKQASTGQRESNYTNHQICRIAIKNVVIYLSIFLSV